MRTPLFPWFILWVTIPIIIFLLFILPAHASDGPFYQRGQEGWFWYQVIPEPEQPDELIEPEAGVVESSQSELSPSVPHGSESICNRLWTRQLMNQRLKTSEPICIFSAL